MFLSNLLGTSSSRKSSFKKNHSQSQTHLLERSLSSSSSLSLSPSPSPFLRSISQTQPQPQSQAHLQSLPPSRSRSQTGETSSKPEYIADESQLEPVAPIPDDVQNLNKDLETLSSLFPDIQAEVFREMLSNFSDESKLFVITEMLLKNPAAYIKGRRRAINEQGGQGAGQQTLIPKTETFRTPAYKEAVRSLAEHDFKGLSKSAINAVLSESNFSYLDARPTLVNLSSKSWRFAISSLFYRRKPVTSSEAKTHPLVVWRTDDRGLSRPTVKTTGNAELDRELFRELVMPLKAHEKNTREKADRAFAFAIQTNEAEAFDAMYECACCCVDYLFEEMTTCNAEGHMVCFRCVQNSITEAVFGQGWQAGIHKATGTLRCPAVSSIDCEGCISSEQIQRAMREADRGSEVLQKLDERLAEHGLLASGLPLIRCPFCSYAEVDELYMPPEARPVRFVWIPGVVLAPLAIAIFFLWPFLLSLGLIVFLLSLSSTFRNFVSQHFSRAISRYRRRQRGLKFTCQNPRCSRHSCMSCSKAWVDVHVCHESSLIALRTQVEQAMSMAVKRVCPRCSTSFVKTAGCNKLTCPCGYKMCYVCRKDIGAPNEGYQHFCQHFRPEGDGRRCMECNKCNLWEAENTDAILRKAKADAERRWKETERRELSDAEKAYLASGVGGLGGGHGESGLSSVLHIGNIPNLEDIFDFIVDRFIV